MLQSLLAKPFTRKMTILTGDEGIQTCVGYKYVYGLSDGERLQRC